MNDSDLDNELDLEMDACLARFARSAREAPLPDEVASLPWAYRPTTRSSRRGREVWVASVGESLPWRGWAPRLP